MDFAALPPEINSARMYTGPGSAPMLAAATAWSGVAAELEAAATAYQTVVSDLSEHWRGAASAAMSAAAAPYVAWLSTAATRAERTVIQARTAAAAYESAFAMTVPPSLIAANRSLLALLVATNVLGQNTVAIAVTEAHYGEMWAQDAAAMYGYAAGSAAATALTPFTSPAQNTNPNGLADQTRTTTAQLLQQLAQPLQSTGGLSGLTSPTALSGLSAPTARGVGGAALGTGALSGLTTGSTAGTTGLALDTVGLGADTVGLVGLETPGLGTEFMGLGIEFYGLGLEQIGAEAVAGPLGIAANGLGTGLGPLSALGSLGGLGNLGLGAAGAAGATASLGEAASLGSLSVPANWATAAPTVIRQVALMSAESGAAAAASQPGAPYAEMALASMAGRAMAGTAGRGLERVAAGGRESTPRSALPAVTAVELRELTELPRELAELRDRGVLTEAEFTQQKQRLLGG